MSVVQASEDDIVSGNEPNFLSPPQNKVKKARSIEKVNCALISAVEA